MFERSPFQESLRHKVLLAALGAIPAAGCSPAATPLPPAPNPPSEAQPIAVVVPVAPSSTPAVVATPTPKQTDTAPNVGPQQAPNDCFTPFTAVRSIGTGEPASPPPPSAFDKHGCLPASQVSNGCCNVANGGPRFTKGFCCYDIPTGPCCGRPFEVDGVARVAEVSRRNDWLERPHRPVDGLALDPSTRMAVAAGWLRDAQMEHASVASFARFVMDLLALGAPSDLVRDAGRALTDEVEHARLCFGLASRFAERDLGPAPLALFASAPSRTFDEIVRSAVLEGCVGETIAAMVAEARLEGTRDWEARNVLSRIRDDETEHAELAWRFVRWVIREKGIVAERVVLAAFRESLGSSPADCEGAMDEPMDSRRFREMGLLSKAEERVVVAAGLGGIVRPAANALLPILESS